MFHWSTFTDLQRKIHKIRCKDCGDEQTGVDWVEKGHSGYQVIYDLCCTKCGVVLYKTHQSTPRMSVDDEDFVEYVDENRYKSFSKGSVSLLGVLLNVICLHHEVQNAILDTFRAVLNLPTWCNDSILDHKKAAARVIQSVSDVSVSKAKEQELGTVEIASGLLVQ